MSAFIPNKTTALALNTKAIDGVDKHFSKVKKLTVGGVEYTPATLKAVLQAESDANKALDLGNSQLKKQQAVALAARAKAHATRKSLKTYILGNYGTDAVDMLADFGMNVPKAPGPLTAKARVLAQAKSKATRDARHTMSKKQKKLIKGVVAPAAQPTQAEAPAVVATVAASNAPLHS
jgi:hypothetical protein